MWPFRNRPGNIPVDTETLRLIKDDSGDAVFAIRQYFVISPTRPQPEPWKQLFGTNLLMTSSSVSPAAQAIWEIVEQYETVELMDKEDERIGFRTEEDLHDMDSE